VDPAFLWYQNDDDSYSSVKGKPNNLSDGQIPGRENWVLLGLFAGTYALWTVGWLIGVAATPPQPASNLLDAIMLQFGKFLAVVSAPVWFSVVWWKTQGASSIIRISLLALGLIVLVPVVSFLPILLSIFG